MYMKKIKLSDWLKYVYLSVIICVSIYWFILIVCRGQGYTVGIVSGIAVFIAFFIIVWLAARQWFRISVGITETIALAVYTVTGGHVPKMLAALVLLLFMISASELVSISMKIKYNNTSLIVMYSIIACVFILMPVRSLPYDWKFVYSFIEKCGELGADISDRMQLLFKGDNGLYNFTYTGYSEGSRISSKKLADDETGQIIVGGERTSRNLYLKGNVCDKFDGRTWFSEEITETLPDRIDGWMSLYACFYLNDEPQDIDEYIEVKQQYISYDNLRTRSVFVPSKTLGIKMTDSSKNLVADGDNTRFKNRQKNGAGYHYIFADMDYSNAKLQNIIAKADCVEYNIGTWNTMITYMKERYKVKPDMSFNEFKRAVSAASGKVKDTYMTVGDELSYNARNLGNETVKNAETDLDKCIKLNNKISSNIYNKGVIVPENANVIDYFLFDQKEGYCIHFATALTQLLRNEGIPARLAEGFLCGYEYDENTKAYIVRGTDAHAWVEAYMEGFGWMKLDAVSSFPRKANQTEKEDSVLYEDITEEDELMTDTSEKANITNDNHENVTEEQIVQDDIGTIRQLHTMGRIIAAAVISFVIIMAVILLSVRVGARYSRKTDIVVKEFLRRTGRKYGKKQNDETIREYLTRIDFRGDKDKAAAIIEMYKYKNVCLTKEQIEFFRSCK